MLKALLFLPMQLQKASLLGWAVRRAKHTPCEMNARWYTLVLVGGVCSVWGMAYEALHPRYNWR